MGGARLWTELLFGKRQARDQVLCGAIPAAAQPAVAAVAALYGALAASATTTIAQACLRDAD